MAQRANTSTSSDKKRRQYTPESTERTRTCAVISAVTLHVFSKVVRPHEAFAANCTLEQPLSRVTLHVSLQVETLLKALPTLQTFVWLFAVNRQVTSEVIITCKALFTLRTTVQLFTSVCKCVDAQVCPLPEPFVTHGTQIRSRLVMKSMFDDIFVIYLKRFIHINDISFSIHLTAGLCVHTRDSRIISAVPIVCFLHFESQRIE